MIQYRFKIIKIEKSVRVNKLLFILLISVDNIGVCKNVALDTSHRCKSERERETQNAEITWEYVHVQSTNEIRI